MIKARSTAKRILNILRQPKRRPDEHERFKWETDALLGVPRRKYRSYQHYIDHQREKLEKVGEPIHEHDRLYEAIVRDRFAPLENFSGKKVICLGARLGGEVRAFKSLGALAIGIDVEPGPENPDVLYGDFHELRFPDESFEIAFTNVIDHVFDLERFLDEAKRVLEPGGSFYIELGCGGSGQYEVLDVDASEPVMAVLSSKFEIQSQEKIANKTNYVSWEGLLIKLRKAES